MAHLDMGLGPLPLHIFKHPPLLDMPCLYQLLRLVKHSQQPLGIPMEAMQESPPHPAHSRRSVAGHQDLVIERHILPPGARIPLPTAAAHELPIDAG